MPRQLSGGRWKEGQDATKITEGHKMALGYSTFVLAFRV